MAALGEWDELLIWITEWGIWPSSEDWPAFYALRGNAGEAGSVSHMPGHLFVPRERPEADRLLTIVLANGWGGYVLPGAAGKLPLRVQFSHDGWVELQSAQRKRFELTGI